ncbi:DUF3558 family protein [Nocardia sp. R7R-8]|uniref:DUF3558 family protein n=1 Tax=Nocardia sp. R7R-8 TaxID=3459304 RepID=UPI00403DCA1D
MRIQSWIGIGMTVLAATTLPGCSRAGSVTAAPASTAQTQSEPMFVGQCGSAGDAEITDISGLGRMRLMSTDPLLCRWEADSAGSSITFKWFRGSPINEYRTDNQGGNATRTTIDVDGHAGFAWLGARSCEVAVSSGAGDFIAWTVESTARPAADECTAATKLATTSLTKR